MDSVALIEDPVMTTIILSMPLGYRIIRKSGKLFFVMADMGPYEAYVLWLQELLC